MALMGLFFYSMPVRAPFEYDTFTIGSFFVVIKLMVRTAQEKKNVVGAEIVIEVTMKICFTLDKNKSKSTRFFWSVFPRCYGL